MRSIHHNPAHPQPPRKQAPRSKTAVLRQKKRRRFWLLTVLVLMVSLVLAHALGKGNASTAPSAVPSTLAGATVSGMTESGTTGASATADIPAGDASESAASASHPASAASSTLPPVTSASPDAQPIARSSSATGTDTSVSDAATKTASASTTAHAADQTAHADDQTAEPAENLPDGFVHVEACIPDIRIDMKYFGSDNFMGRPAAGYEANTAILTQSACDALARVQTALQAEGLSLVIYDAYRPRSAVEDFVAWASDTTDQATKQTYYPNLEKTAILDGGYIAVKSSHSRGSTVDLSVVDTAGGEALDMGCPFDWFGKEADPDWTGASNDQAANRRKLRLAMEREGFVVSAIEWWHFRLRNEPYPKTTFDFPVR